MIFKIEVRLNLLSQVEFIVGREIEIGGTYKGVVTSIKEYGAFVEFNGGQQGLLHISELSHDQVCRLGEVYFAPILVFVHFLSSTILLFA